MKRLSLIALLFAALPLFAQEGDVEDAPNAEVTDPVDVTVEAEVTDEGVDVDVTFGSEEEVVVTEESEVVASGGQVFVRNGKTYTSADVKFKIDAEDSGSGVKAIFVVMDGQESFEYSEPLSVTVEGKHAFSYQVEDNVGNVSESKTYSFIMDQTAPVMTFTMSNVSIFDDVIHFGPESSLGYTALDHLSGLEGIYYSINGETEKSFDKESFMEDMKTGEQVDCYVYAIDNVGNVSEMEMNMVLFDKVGPETTITLDPEAFSRFDVNYISTTTLVSITAEDADSAVEKIEYSINGEDFVEYSSAFTLEAGTYKIVARSYDDLDNLGEETTVEVVVDGESPTAEVITTD